MENDRLDQAKELYSRKSARKLMLTKVQNSLVRMKQPNLILSGFADKDYKRDISMEIKAQIPTMPAVIGEE